MKRLLTGISAACLLSVMTTPVMAQTVPNTVSSTNIGTFGDSATSLNNFPEVDLEAPHQYNCDIVRDPNGNLVSIDIHYNGEQTAASFEATVINGVLIDWSTHQQALPGAYAICGPVPMSLGGGGGSGADSKGSPVKSAVKPAVGG